ncbi:Putative porin [Bacteroidales bacterium WCE2004]|nr:Putative porin [Bacteroidales bacterium WCE2004]
MNLLSRIAFPIAVTASVALGATDFHKEPAPHVVRIPEPAAVQDTVTYPVAGYKLRRALSLEEIVVRDTSAADELPDSMAVALDTVLRLSPRDSFKAQLDTSLWDKLDSLYLVDSTARAKAAFDAWYAGLSREERRKYDFEQKAKRKVAEADSLMKLKEKRKEIRDSIAETTPRILETYALPDSLHFKRLVAWTRDPDFGKMTPTVPDTTYNAHFHDYPFQRNDVNGSWLGMAGSPAQPYNWFLRRSREGVDFYDAQESWSYSHATLPHYNTKVPYTELAYFGTLFASREKESDNLHIFTTQNITPAFNFALLFDRYGGEGILENETTANKTAVVQANYLGKRYTAHAGYIYNMVKRGENGGIQDIGMIRDTTVEARDIRVNLTNASSQIKKNTFFLDQQLRIPFTFIEKMRARRDSTYSFDADSLNRDITTAYIGHSSELSTYTRNYEDYIQDEAGTDFYGGVFRYGPQTADSMRVLNLDNKVYLRLQPWAEDGAVSRLDIGVGDRLRQYFDSSAVRPTTHSENSFYLYGGAEGRLFKTAWWDAKARFVLLGHGMGDFDIEANAGFRFYPFRRARKSPVTVDAHFDSVLEEPTWYQRHLNLNHFSWDNEFGKITTTRFQGHVDIPRWRMSADVGYALLGGNIYYDTKGIVRQNTSAMSVLSATLRKEFKLGPVHLDHRALFQYSSKPEVLPLPMVALNFRYYLEFVVQRNERRQNVLTMQIGADAYWNTPWNSPAWNPNLGVFHNQDERSYTNGPWFDIFINMQWKRACVFIKYQNAGMGWPLLHPDYFSADRYAITESGMNGLKFGIFWPFYTQPGRPGSGGRSSSAGSQQSGNSPRGGGISSGGAGRLATESIRKR